MPTRETKNKVALDYKKGIYYLAADGYLTGAPRGGGAKFRVGNEKVVRDPKKIYWVSEGFVWSKPR